MKILMTGFTARSVESKRLRYDYVTFCFLLRDALRVLGHQVEMRKVEMGEDLSSYDRAFVCVSLLSSLSSLHPHTAAYVLRTLGDKCFLYCDDWSIEKFGYDWGRKLGPDWEKYLKFRSEVGALSKEQQSEFHDTLKQVISGQCPWPIIAPMFPWGDHGELLRGSGVNAKLLPVDPTGFHYAQFDDLRKPIDSVVRKRQWVLATLQDHDQWLKKVRPTWPVEGVGNKRKEQEVVPEAYVRRMYEDSWGVLSPKYAKAGCGWWRTRYQFAALAGAVLLCDEKDAPGEPYRKSCFNIEHRDDKELRDLARDQQDCFFSQVWTHDRFLNSLKEIL